MGRPRTPTIIKRLEGNPGKRSLNDNEPVPLPALPDPPRGMSDAGRREWKWVVDSQAPGLVRSVDSTTLAMYCEAWSDYMACRRSLKKHGRTFVNDKGNITKNPMVTVMNDAREAVLKCARELGFTPAARCKLSVPLETEEDPLDAFMREADSA